MSVADTGVEGFSPLLGLTYRGNALCVSPDGVGVLRRSDEVVDNREALHERMAEDGYLYLPGLLNREDVLAARREVLERLAAYGGVDERFPLMDGVYKAGGKLGGGHALARNNPALERAIYAGPMIAFYEFFLGGPVRHFDYTWFRVKAPGVSSPTTPHYDVVYMGRGTKALYTSWTPLGDVPVEMGGLMLLEGSHRVESLRRGYGQTDVDAFCETELANRVVEKARAERRDLTPEERAQVSWNSTGAYASDAPAVQQELGGRWLTADYALGDVLIFGMFTMHASSDNHTDRIRLSSDSRYQLASEAVDERWIGDDPPAHGIRAKRGMIC